jgi:hypothetical protein
LQAIHQAGLVHCHLTPEAFLLTGDGIVKLSGLGEPAWLIESAGNGTTEDAAADLAALGQIVSGWAAQGQSAGKKARRLPEALQSILTRLTAAEAGQRYPHPQALLEELERVGSEVPANAEAWDRLLRHVRDRLTTDSALRQSA